MFQKSLLFIFPFHVKFVELIVIENIIDIFIWYLLSYSLSVSEISYLYI